MRSIPERQSVKHAGPGFGPTPPRCLPSTPENVPAELRKLKQWVCWRYEWAGDKWTKVPKQADGWRAASTTDARTWATFKDALAGYNARRADGVGFVTCKRDPYVLIDLDHVLDPATGVVQPWAAEVVNAALGERAYVEFSPSVTGFHVIGRGKQGFTGAKANGAELYCWGRFFTITGALAGTGAGRAIGTLRETVALTRAHMGTQAPATGKVQPVTHGPVVAAKCPYPKGTTDVQILTLAFRAKNGAHLKSLLDGDTSDYASDSEADAAAASALAFWFWLDPVPIERVMRNSQLRREKWDRNKSYLARTIQFVLNGKSDYFGKGQRP